MENLHLCREALFFFICVLGVFTFVGKLEGKSAEVGDVHSRKSEKSTAIREAWATIYGLRDGTAPPEILDFSALPDDLQAYGVPPHLQNCHKLSQERQKLETHREDGSFPSWTQPSDVYSEPQPPWVRGADSDNLAKTRKAQTDIWKLQFPANNCSAPDLKFAIVDIVMALNHGVGSQFHIISMAMSQVMKAGRIFVYSPNTFERARHHGCEGNHYGSMDCYYFPITSAACTERAIALWNEKLPGTVADVGLDNLKAGLEADTPVVHLEGWTEGIRYEAQAAELWGTPWLEDPENIDIFGQIRTEDPNADPHLWKVMWWRSQSIRFMLRWPSQYLCHLTNIVREATYGRHVAHSLLRRRRELSRKVTLTEHELELVQGVSVLSPESIESKLWANDEPYIPRPIVSIYVRQGDKEGEMELFTFASHLWLAERIRLHNPSLRTAWLSTEMQSVVESAETYRDWRFLYTNNSRQVGKTKFNTYESDAGVKQVLENSLVNLLISSQCDYFVGGLGSNWARLINELRLTNGRLKAGYLSVNINEF